MGARNFAIGLALIASFAAPVSADTIAKIAPAGQATRIDQYTGWNDDCSFKSLHIDVIDKPAHGQVTGRIANGVIPKEAKVGSTGLCAGKPTKVLEVYYRPERGFHGLDHFTVNMSFDGSAGKDFNYDVTVP